jgi:hypothetical protein
MLIKCVLLMMLQSKCAFVDLSLRYKAVKAARIFDSTVDCHY